MTTLATSVVEVKPPRRRSPALLRGREEKPPNWRLRWSISFVVIKKQSVNTTIRWTLVPWSRFPLITHQATLKRGVL